MQERVRRRSGPGSEVESVNETPPSARDGSTAGDIRSELDDILDQIDDVLEENAEEFVRNYVQKGGE